MQRYEKLSALQPEPEPEPEPELPEPAQPISEEGVVYVQYDGIGEFEQVWMSLAVDDMLTIRSNEGGPVLRTASASLCHVSPVKSRRAEPYEHAFALTLWEKDDSETKKYVISCGGHDSKEFDVDMSAELGSGSATQGVDSATTDAPTGEMAQPPEALRRWKEALGRTVQTMSGEWRWQFAVVFGLLPTEDEDHDDCEEDVQQLAKDDLEELVVNWCIVFHKWHFEVAVAERTEQTKDRVMVLLKMDDSQIEKYFREVEIDRWQKSADGITLREIPQRSSAESRASSDVHATEDLNMTVQDRVFTMAHVLS
jgi:hypothetical protein